MDTVFNLIDLGQAPNHPDGVRYYIFEVPMLSAGVLIMLGSDDPDTDPADAIIRGASGDDQDLAIMADMLVGQVVVALHNSEHPDEHPLSTGTTPQGVDMGAWITVPENAERALNMLTGSTQLSDVVAHYVSEYLNSLEGHPDVRLLN